MNLPILVAVFFFVLSVFSGILALTFYLRSQQLRKSFVAQIDSQKQRFLETTILQEIQSKIGYSFDIEKVIEILTTTTDNLLPYSVVSSIIIKPNKLKIKTHTKEPVNPMMVQKLRDAMFASIGALRDNKYPTTIDEDMSQAHLSENSSSTLGAYFHIPFFVNQVPVGIVSIASTKPHAFTQEQMELLYKIADFTSQTISRFETIVTIEKGKLMAMIGSLGDGLFMINMISQITVMNDAAKAYLGINSENPTIMQVLSALPNTYNFGNKIQQVMQKNQPMIAKNVHIGDRFFEIFLTPVLDVSVTTEEKVIGASILLHDVTLEESVAQMKEDFTNIIVHELRSPLTSIKASSQLLTSKVQLDEQEKTKLIRLIFDQTNKLLDEVSLILDAAKLEAGLFKIQKEAGDLKEVIQEKVNTFQPQAESKQIHLITDIDQGLPKFYFDPQHIGHVITNLISNSMKFTPLGGTIRVGVRQIKGAIEVAVSDTGPGIPKEKQHLLFSKFTQLSSPNAHVGTGLGLYFVKGVVNAHGGEVALDSEVGKGTTISFTLPMEMPHTTETADHATTGQSTIQTH